MTKSPTTLRGTGRTTRMVQRAIQLNHIGKAVYIIAANLAEQHRIEHILPEHLRGQIKVETSDTPGNFSWEHMALIGAHPNCVVLADHFAIECHFAAILKELHAYDQA
jgi:hypothetical protein